MYILVFRQTSNIILMHKHVFPSGSIRKSITLTKTKTIRILILSHVLLSVFTYSPLHVAMIMRTVTQVSFLTVTLSLQEAFLPFKDILIQKAGCRWMRTSVRINPSCTVAATFIKLRTTGHKHQKYSQRGCINSSIQFSATCSHNISFHQDCFNAPRTGRTLFTE